MYVTITTLCHYYIIMCYYYIIRCHYYITTDPQSSLQDKITVNIPDHIPIKVTSIELKVFIIITLYIQGLPNMGNTCYFNSAIQVTKCVTKSIFYHGYCVIYLVL